MIISHYFISFLVQMKTYKFAFEINWLLKQNASKEVSTFETLPSTKNFASSFNQSQDSFKLPLLHKSWLEKYTNQAKNDTERWRFILTVWLCDMKNKKVINTFEMEFPMTWSTIVFEQMNRNNIFFYDRDEYTSYIWAKTFIQSAFCNGEIFSFNKFQSHLVSLFGYAVKYLINKSKRTNFCCVVTRYRT